MTKFVHKEMRRLMGKAIHKHSMTEEDDHILISVSGGKDSMALLWLMRERLRRLPINYRITAVHVDPGFGGDNAAQMKDYFEEHGFDYRILSGISDRRPTALKIMKTPVLCAQESEENLFLSLQKSSAATK